MLQAAIDPVEPEKVLQKARERGVKVTHILTTHQVRGEAWFGCEPG